MLNVLLTICAGAFGWATTHFVLTPVLQFYELRRTTHDEFLYHASASTVKELAEAHKVHRHLATKWKAFHDTNWRWITCYFIWRGYDLDTAVGDLMRYSNVITGDASWRPLAFSDRVRVEKSLRLPLSMGWDKVEATEAEWMRRALE